MCGQLLVNCLKSLGSQASCNDFALAMTLLGSVDLSLQEPQQFRFPEMRCVGRVGGVTWARAGVQASIPVTLNGSIPPVHANGEESLASF